MYYFFKTNYVAIYKDHAFLKFANIFFKVLSVDSYLLSDRGQKISFFKQKHVIERCELWQAIFKIGNSIHSWFIFLSFGG